MRLRVLVLESFESNIPCVCECFLECKPSPPLGGKVNGEPVLTLLGSVFGSARPGREKLCRLLELLFESCAKLVEAVGLVTPVGDFGLLILAMEIWDVVSSLLEDSILLICGREEN